MASSLFCHGLWNDFSVELLFCIHLLKAGIFGFQHPYFDHQRCIHTCVFGVLFVEGGRADAIGTHLNRCFSLLQDGNALAISKS